MTKEYYMLRNVHQQSTNLYGPSCGAHLARFWSVPTLKVEYKRVKMEMRTSVRLGTPGVVPETSHGVSIEYGVGPTIILQTSHQCSCSEIYFNVVTSPVRDWVMWKVEAWVVLTKGIRKTFLLFPCFTSFGLENDKEEMRKSIAFEKAYTFFY